MTAIKIDKLTKKYRNGVLALDQLSLQVENGEIFTLLGPNGAGKSSLINIMTTYLSPTSGTVTILGNDIRKKPGMIRTQIACVAQRTSIDLHLSLEENMLFQSMLYKVSPSTAKAWMKNLIDRFDLEHYLNYPTASYSGGVKRRLDIAMTLMSQPKILFLDEPTVGMDVQSRLIMWDMVKKIRKDFGTTIFLTTHYLEEADQLSDSICIMKDGHEIVQASPCDLRKYTKQDILQIRFDQPEQAKYCAADLQPIAPSTLITVQDTSVFIREENIRTKFSTINRWLLERDISFTAIEMIQPTIEDVFLTLTADQKEVSA